jgi:prepilin-type N-terminal cleavage/methylation domain-containing protein
MTNTSAGFSLIEILVSIALLSIMSGIGVSLYAIVNNSYTRANTISAIQSQGSSVMEGVERNVRSALSATTSPDYTCPSGTECLSLTMPNSSIEYRNSGNCPVTEYDWIAPNPPTTNGRLQKAWKNADGSACNGSSPTDLFNSDATKGISVEKVNGQDHIFSVTTSVNSPTNVLVAMNLMDGVKLNNSTRSQVPFITTISLRTYAN